MYVTYGQHSVKTALAEHKVKFQPTAVPRSHLLGETESLRQDLKYYFSQKPLKSVTRYFRNFFPMFGGKQNSKSFYH